MIHSGNTLLAGIVGWPVAHSRSPRLHGFWLDQLGIDGAYLPLAVQPDDFTVALRGLAASGFRGVNVTVPHKEAALRLCDEVTPQAARIGAVNTIIVQEGRLFGSNSDGFGFLENLRQEKLDWRPEIGACVVLGAGGAARAILAALQDAGAPEIRLTNRTAARAQTLAEEFGAPVVAVSWEERAEALAEARLLVNTTSLGMEGHLPLELSLDALPRDALVTDIVYVPLQTDLLAAAAARGNPTVDGLGMLLHQARPGFEAWFGRTPEVTPELRRFVLSDID